MDGKLDLDEIQKLDVMYEGDSSRDASDKIRGFLFQDLVAIDSLLDDGTEYVCLEYLEDVDVFCKDGTVKIVQAKYYPRKSPIMKEIITDLYYQYLRMQLLESRLTSKPQLVIHRKEAIRKPDLNTMKTYIGSLKEEEPEKISDLPKWLKENVYKHTKKEEQKKTLFNRTAYEASALDFINDFEIIKKNDIKTYKDEVGNKLGETFLEYDSYGEEQKKSILLGLAINYIQKRYIQDNCKFDQLKVAKSEFVEYIRQTMQGKTEDHMIAYGTSFILEQYTSILIENPNLNNDYIELLNQIVNNTQKWISEILSTEEGQFQLLNTISSESHDNVKGYLKLRTSQKMFEIIRCSNNLQTFLFYLWKIMIDLCMTKPDFSIEQDADMLDPQKYIEKTEKKYICVKFPMDCVQTSVILPTIRTGQEGRDRKNIATRMYLEKPQKWYMAGNAFGKKDYEYPVSAIREEGSIVDIETDCYIVECLKCIKIDEGKWENIEICETCIFANECVERK